MSNNRQGVARILYKELLEGDLRKLKANSNNDAASGGGARDFRFRSYDRLLPVFKELFPETVRVSRTRGNEPTLIDIFKGEFFWHDAEGNIVHKEAQLEPPTSARPGEGRIARVHEYPCFDASNVTIGPNNRVLLLLIQLVDGTVWPYYAEEQSLRTKGKWHSDVASELLDCLDAQRPARRAALGFCDFVSQDRYCNGE